ncbi:telomerase protein component 1-like isoform X2 [Lineus longissimus]|uniref:telomerase protein component 1-like isoform X2 n=1 Tax=Lineus longissimus TaxID=88925 RepID=UPI00315DF2E8
MYRNYKKNIDDFKGKSRCAAREGISTEEDEETACEDSDLSDNEIPEDPIEAEVKKCWNQVRKQRHDYDHQPWPTEPLRNNLGWQTIRIFVSSTFADFQNEREILVKQVFPELRDWLEQRSMRLLECDLRWGIPKDSNTHDTIVACMEEIDSCFEENHGEPFFLNLTGARCGWIPTMEDISDDIRERYDWIPGVSITFMEVLHAAMRRNNPNAAFFIRDGDFYFRLPSAENSKFVDEDPLKVHHLKKYKEKLMRYFPKQTFLYKCQYSRMEEVCGRDRVMLVGYEDFSEKVLNFFKKTIEMKYPHYKDVKEMNVEQRENASHMNFMMQKADFVCGRSSEIDLLSRYVEHDYDESLRLSDKDIETYKSDYRLSQVLEKYKTSELELAQSTPILCVFAPPGYGKSALLASFIKKVSESDDLNYLKIFYHFCGKDGDSTRLDMLMWRLLLAMDPHMSESKEEVMQLPGNEMVTKFNEMLDLYQKTEKQLVIVIDGINELQAGLHWLPPGLPSKVTCIVSCSNQDTKTMSDLLLLNSLRLDLPDIGLEPRRKIVQTFFWRYSKTLDSEQLESLVQQEGSSNPLWLLTACEELRVIGDYKYITDMIKAFPSDLEGLFSDLLNRLMKEDETGLIEKVLCYIEVSPFGLAEDILKKLVTGAAQVEPIAPLKWAKVKRQLKSLLRPYMARQMMLQFRHASISKAVHAKFLKDKLSQKVWHEELASYYEFYSQGDPVHLTRQALPYHLLEAGLNKRLVEFYRKNQFMASIYQRRQQLQQIRCKNIAIQKASKKAQYCTFCSMNVQGKCIICGMHLHKAMEKEAWLCHMHQFHGGKGMDKCSICGRIQSNNMLKGEVHMCVFCHTGTFMNRCAAFEM